METISEWRAQPNYLCGIGDNFNSWIVTSIARTRDSDLITESNFETVLARLNADCSRAGADDDGSIRGDFEIMTDSHWACGWIEHILVRPGSKAAGIVSDFEMQIADYPVLDDDDLSRREYEAMLSIIADALHFAGFDPDAAADVYSWLSDSDEYQDQTYYYEGGREPSEDAIEAAAAALDL